MIGGLTYRTKTAATNAIQQRIDTLYLRYQNNDITVDELLLGLSYVVAKKNYGKKKKIIIYIDSLKLVNLFYLSVTLYMILLDCLHSIKLSFFIN